MMYRIWAGSPVLYLCKPRAYAKETASDCSDGARANSNGLLVRKAGVAAGTLASRCSTRNLLRASNACGVDGPVRDVRGGAEAENHEIRCPRFSNDECRRLLNGAAERNIEIGLGVTSESICKGDEPLHDGHLVGLLNFSALDDVAATPMLNLAHDVARSQGRGVPVRQFQSGGR